MTAVVGLGGKLRAGKDVVADHLVRQHGFVKIGMSDALHEALLAVDPIVEAEFGHPPIRYSEAIAAFGYVKTKAQYPEARRLLQKLGTEVGRDMIGEDVWADIAMSKIHAHLVAGRSVVITGIRFPNELRMINRFADGVSVWIERPGLEETSAASHASENGVRGSDFAVTLLNDSSLENLRRLTDDLARNGADHNV